MEFEQREVRLRTGTCPSCAKEFALLEGSEVASRMAPLPAEPGRTPAEGEEGETESAGEPLECEECGSPLSVRAGRAGTLEVSCPDCETVTVYAAKQGSRGPERQEGTRGRYEPSAPRVRPCRQCGAPLRFSTTEDGGVVGECDSCGNRFTLPPRRGGEGGRGLRGRPNFDRRNFRSGSRGRPYYSGRGRDRAGRSYRGAEGRGPPPDEEPRRRRRRRDE